MDQLKQGSLPWCLPPLYPVKSLLPIRAGVLRLCFLKGGSWACFGPLSLPRPFRWLRTGQGECPAQKCLRLLPPGQATITAHWITAGASQQLGPLFSQGHGLCKMQICTCHCPAPFPHCSLDEIPLLPYLLPISHTCSATPLAMQLPQSRPSALQSRTWFPLILGCHHDPRGWDGHIQ